MSGLFKVVPYKWEWLVLFCLLAMTLAPGFVSADRVVDDFSTVQATLLGLDSGTTVNALDTSIIGSERDINVQGLLTGSVQVAAGLLDAQISLLANQSFLVVWDGPDADADTTDVTGLGGVDLTEFGTVDGVEITVAMATGPCDIGLSIFTDDSNSSRSTTSIVADSTGPLFLPFALFSPETGTGADMTNVGAISLELTTTTDGLLQSFSVAAVKTSRSLTATLTAELLDDNDFDALASPGDTVRYTATITNPEDRKAAPSTGVTFTASPGSNTTLVLGPTTTSQGSVTTGNTAGDTAVAVDIGTLTDGASATITFDALIRQPISPSVTQVSCQGSVTSDTIASGFSTDDPGAGGTTDATVTPIVKTVIGGTVLNDINGNGTNDAGENGLSGVTLDFHHDADGSGTISAPDDRLAVVTTNASGVFTAGVANHTNFLVEVTDTGGILTGLSLISGTTPSVLTIAPEGSITDLLFGYAASSTIGDTIWDDANGDGILNMGENGVPGVTVNLYSDLDSNGMISGVDSLKATVTTGSGGLYDFTALDPGPYIVDVTDTGAVLAGYAPTTTEPLALNLSSGEDNNDADFGFQSTASIGGIVWMDTNGDDVHTAEELGVDNVTLDLYRDLNGDRMVDVGDPLLETQATAADGTFEFAHRPPGNYLVTVTDTNGKLSGYNSATAVFLAIALSAGENKKDADFGFHTTASIGGQIWKDSDGNGIRDTGEMGFNGVTVALYRDINADGILDGDDILEATLLTSDGGIYSFANLIPGDYLIIITDTANVLANYSLQTSSPRAIHVNPGESLTNEDVAATDKVHTTASIGGHIWKDSNGNGIRDTGEVGFNGVTVALYRDINADGILDGGDILEATLLTSDGGIYSFANLIPGDYLIIITDTANVLANYSLQTSSPRAIHVNPGESLANEDVAATDKVHTTASIGGQIWKDNNGNGIRDTGEVGFNGVTVAIYRDINADGILDGGDILEATLLTSNGGIYSFANLMPGDYLIIITDTANVLANYSLETSSTRAIHVNPGESLTNEDVAATDKEGSISCFIMTLAP